MKTHIAKLIPLSIVLMLCGCTKSFTLWDVQEACANGVDKYEHRTHRETKRFECAKDE